MAKTDRNSLIMGGVLVIAAIFAYNMLVSPQPAQIFQVAPTEPARAVATCDATQTGTLTVGAIDRITKATADVNAELWSEDNNIIAGETEINSAASTLSSNVPMYFRGYIMIGNDDFQSTTDRGTDYYYTKVPVDFGCQGQKSISNIQLAAESTPTWTGYDDNVKETTLNITVGSGETVTTAALQIKAGADAYLGNPEFTYPLAVAFNESTSGMFDEIRPAKYVEKIPVPEFMAGMNMLPNAYVLPTGAIADYDHYRFDLVIKARTGQNPGVTDYAYAFLLDKGYYKSDAGIWEVGWADNSDQGTDQDLGIAAIGNEFKINFN